MECLKLFAAGAISAAVELGSSSEIRKSNESTQSKEGNFTQAEIDDCSEKIAESALQLAKCLKGKDTPESLQEKLNARAKEIGESIGKYAANGLLKKFISEKIVEMNYCITESKKKADKLDSYVRKEFQAMEEELERLKQEIIESIAIAREIDEGTSSLFQGLTGAYAELVKLSDGAISMSAKVTANLEKFKEARDFSKLTTAASAIEGQLNDAIKAKKDKLNPDFLLGAHALIDYLRE